MMKNEQQNSAALIAAMKEYPDLQIVPMVSSDVVCDDSYNYWLGSIGNVSVDKYICLKDTWGDQRFFCREGDYDEIVDILADREEYEHLGTADEGEVARVVATLDWTKAIIVYIDTPE